jgi:hypothetical protein
MENEIIISNDKENLDISLASVGITRFTKNLKYKI